MMKMCFRCLALALLSLSFLAGCSSVDKPKPASLGPEPSGLQVRALWTSRIGVVQFPLQVAVAGDRLAVAASDGMVALLDGKSGIDLWRTSVGAPLTAGAGSDGHRVAVVTHANEVTVVREGKVQWRQRLSARVLTAPLIAGERVFVLAADRSVHAFDAESGQKLWAQARTQSESLVLEQSGAIFPVGNTLVVGFSGRLAGLNPANGNTLWESPFASSRASNDVERLIDVVGPVSRIGHSVCARAFQNAIACLDVQKGHILWSKLNSGSTGLSGDNNHVFGAQADGTVVAFSRDRGEKIWSTELLAYRQLSAPLSVGSAIVVGDGMGYLHWLSKDRGDPVARVQVDSSAVAVSPVVVAGRVVAVSRNGTVAAYVTN
jgi:outer membrane protein assembly factor BamB